MRIPLAYRLTFYVLAAVATAVVGIVAYDISTHEHVLLAMGTRDAESFTSAVYEQLAESMRRGGGREEHDAILRAFSAADGVNHLKVIAFSPLIEEAGDASITEGFVPETMASLREEADGGRSVRYQAPMLADESCARCHQVRPGEAAGLLSLTLSLDRYGAILEHHGDLFILWCAGIMVSAAVVLVLGVRRRVLGPLGLIKRAVETIASGDLGHRVRLATGDEFEALGYSLSEMAAALHSLTSSLVSLSERHMTLMEMAPDAIVLIESSGGRVSEVNPAAEALTGYSREELVGGSVEYLFPETVRTDYEHAVDSWSSGDGRGYLHDATVVRKNGSSVDIDIAASVVEIGGAVYLQEIWRDLSDRKNYEMARRNYVKVLENTVQERTAHLTRSLIDLRESEQRLVQSAKLVSLGEMCAGIAHELNSPMAGILSITEVLRARLDGDGRTTELLDTLKDAVVRSRGIILDMLAYSRGTQPELLPLSINDVVSSTIGVFKSLIKLRSIELTEELAQGLFPVKGDMGRLMEVVLNLLKNATDAAGEGGRVRISTECRYVADGSFVVIEVSDSGSGIDEAIMGRIFEPFFTTKEKGGGLNIGLGLSISSTIVREHGGLIEVENAGDGTWGAVFRVTLPAIDTGAADGVEPA